MNESEFTAVRSSSSGKISGVGGVIVLILFGTLFAGFGIVALVQGLKKIVAGDTGNGVALCIFGSVFSMIGLGIMFGAIWGQKKSRRAAELRDRFPGKPWMLRDDWAAGKVKSSTMGQPALYLIMAVAFCGVGGLSTFFALPEVWLKHNYPALLVLLFPLAGIGFFVAFINAWRSKMRFGDCYFEPAEIPVPLGGVLDGMIQTGHPLKLEHEFDLKFSCVRRVVTGSGKGRSVNEYVLWQNEKVYSQLTNLIELDPGHTGIPVHFNLPDNQPECYSRGDESVFWRLEARSKMRGPAFRAIFELPVFKVAGAAAAETDAADPTAALQSPIEEIRRDENSKIKVSDGPNGREFYFPAARNLGTAFALTIFFVFWTAIFYVLLHAKAPAIFPVFWGITDAFIGFGCFNLWFKSSRITIDSAVVRATTRWLLFGRTRQFSANEVTRFATKVGMQSGSRVYTDIKLIPRGNDEKFTTGKEKFREPQTPNQLMMTRLREAAGPAGVTVAVNIASPMEAEWLVAEMNKLLGRKI
ncbi:MAG TPA: hypothetical protein VGY56_14235 [Verrucomicrobiae bacterium]|nr:hypothetical protein [Verrucomicrobiae bacterium]